MILITYQDSLLRTFYIEQMVGYLPAVPQLSFDVLILIEHFSLQAVSENMIA